MISHQAVKGLLICLVVFGFILLVVAGCGTNTPSPTQAPTIDDTPMPTSSAESSGTPVPESTSEAGGISLEGISGTLVSELGARTPVPTATPDFIEREVDQFASETGLDSFSFLGLTGTDWINLLASTLIFVIGYVVVVRLLYRFLKRAAQRTTTKLDDEILKAIGTDLKRIAGLLLLNHAIQRLAFLPVRLKALLDDLIFVVGLVFVAIACFKLVNLAVEWYRKFIEHKESKDDHHLDPVIALLQHASYIFIIVIAVLVGLLHFGVDINLLVTILLILGLGTIWGTRAILIDLVAGFIILVGQDYREGDAIQIEGWPDYGFIEQIESRATHIRTLDSREVIVRNSEIINSQLINYSTPDSTRRVQTDLRISYHADIDQVRQLITETVRNMDGVLRDQPVEVLFRRFGDSTRLISVRWWIPDFDQEYYIVDDVNSAIEAALEGAGFEIPHDTVDLNLNQIGDLQQMLAKLASKTGDPDSESDSSN